ncbi:hypothetical protein Tco_0615827, partial [Tanacetum coccineum]
KMVEEKVPALAPTRSNEHILPFNAEDAKTGVYSFQLDEHWFTLNADLLRKALEITPVDSAHPFESPLVGEQVMDFVNELGYLEEIHFVSKMHGIVTRSNVDYAELLWEEFVQAIKTFFTDKANLSLPTKKPKPHVIPYCRFTKLIIYYFGSRHNIHKRPVSPVHVTGDDFLLEYYKKYLEMAARKPTAKEGGKKKTTSKADKPTKSALAKQPALAKQTKPVKEKTSKPTPSKKICKGKVMKVYKGKRSDHLIDEEDEEDQPASEPQVEDDEYNLQRGITRQLLVVEGKGKGIVTDERISITQDASTGPSAQPQDDTSANVVRDTPSPADAKTGADTEKSNSEGDTKILNVVEEQGKDVYNTVAREERTVKLNEVQARSDPGKTLES